MNEVFDSAYAYSPRENTGSRGGYHLITTQHLHIGRFHRQPGDALCKSRSKFWGKDKAVEPKNF